MKSFLLLDLPDNLVIFLFMLFAVNFYILRNMNVLKVFKLIIAGLFIFIVNIFSANILKWDMLIFVFNPLLISVFWMVLFDDMKLKRFVQIFTGTFAIYLFKFLVQFYIPVIQILFHIEQNTFQSMLTDVNKSFLFILPARIMEFALIYFIYKYQKKTWDLTKLTSRSITFVAEKASNTATLFWIYQLKEPKLIKKVH